MNYTVRLQDELAAERRALQAIRDALQQFRVHLHSPKFAGTDPDGNRRDWIAAADVLAWLAHIETSNHGA